MRILSAPRNVWCEPPVTTAGVLVDGDDYYRALYAAAAEAQHYILLAGWQFDSDACLLRGEEAQSAALPVTLLAFLDALCARNPDLHVYILAWDFHVVFALEREFMQAQRFNWTTNDRLRFMFDDNHVDGASHHQKFAVIDGELAFLGGLDLCDQRWDDRGHTVPNPLRSSRGTPHKPFHDLQAYIVGHEAVGAITSLFAARWAAAGGGPLALPTAAPRLAGYAPTGATALPTARVALSRTDPRGYPEGTPDRREIFTLYADAIDRAQRLIYIETQYLSSKDLGEVLMQRIRAPGRSALDIAIVINHQAQTIKEEIAIGLAQAKVIAELRHAATGTEHRLGIYYTVPATEDDSEPDSATYIHSKMMIVDDRLLTVGSANLTNRSLGIDTELNVTVESETDGDDLGRAIYRLRHELISEHLGLEDFGPAEDRRLVDALCDLAARREGRLRIHPSPTDEERAALAVIDPQQLPFDPDAYETHDHTKSIFVDGLGVLWRRISGCDASQG